MFSGLIAHLGRVRAIDGDAARGMRLVVEAPDALVEGVADKDSIAINGVCLTVAAHDAQTMTFDVVPETVIRAGFSAVRAGESVNVELSLRLGDRLGGHFVYGHVDGTVRILAKEPEGQGQRLTLERPPALAAYIVEKGYVAVDGVSLTVASVSADRFTIALIPETLKRTTLGSKGAAARVNLEIDPVARYAIAATHDYVRGGASSDELAWAYEI
jgi:riboflavin synthase